MLVSRPCDKHGRDTNFWKVQPLRGHGHLLARVGINTIIIIIIIMLLLLLFCSGSLFGLCLQHSVYVVVLGVTFFSCAFASAGRVFVSQLIGPGESGGFFTGSVYIVRTQFCSCIWQLGSIVHLQLWSLAVGFCLLGL